MSKNESSWQKVRLDGIGESLIGLTYSPDNVKRSGTLVLRSSNIQSGRLTFDDVVYVNSTIPDKIRVREDDILICVRNGSRRLIGKSVLLDRRVVGQTFGAFMAVYRSEANPYLQYFFQSDDFKRQIDEHLGATINQITNGSLNSFIVALPNAAEQREIVSRLSDVDRYIATLERLIAKKQVVKQGMMQQLITGRTRLPGFTESWRTSSLGAIGNCLRGVSYDPNFDLSPNDRPFTVRLLRSNNIQNGHLELRDVQFVHERKVNKKQLVRHNDILVCLANGSKDLVGKSAILQFPTGARKYTFGAFMGIFRTDKRLADPRFIANLLQAKSFRDMLDVALAGSSINNLRPGDVEAFVTKMPPMAEQGAIADTLSDAELEIQLLNVRLIKARSIKKGMMQELLTGRTRLPAAEASL